MVIVEDGQHRRVTFTTIALQEHYIWSRYKNDALKLKQNWNNHSMESFSTKATIWSINLIRRKTTFVSTSPTNPNFCVNLTKKIQVEFQLRLLFSLQSCLLRFIIIAKLTINRFKLPKEKMWNIDFEDFASDVNAYSYRIGNSFKK